MQRMQPAVNVDEINTRKERNESKVREQEQEEKRQQEKEGVSEKARRLREKV